MLYSILHCTQLNFNYIETYFNYNPILIIIQIVNTTTIVTTLDNSKLKYRCDSLKMVNKSCQNMLEI
jgi:hypothetical protein